jgi:hypothetical protein
MAGATGAGTTMVLAYESTYGTAPASGYLTMPFAQQSLGTTQPLLENEVLGLGRDPAAPLRDSVTSDGNVTIPVGVNDIGYWLKGLLGSPTTTGTTPKVHTFVSGAASLPSMTIGVEMPQVPHFEMFSGAMVNSLQFNMQRGGLLQATASLMSQGSALFTETQAGTPDAVALTRFGQFNGAVQRNGSALANMLTADFTYSNNLQPIDAIRADGKVDGFDLGLASLSGSITMRFANTTLLTQAINGEACSLEFSFTISSSQKLVMTAHAVYLPRPRIQVDGPNGVNATFDFMAAKAASPARMFTAVLTNSVGTY